MCEGANRRRSRNVRENVASHTHHARYNTPMYMKKNNIGRIAVCRSAGTAEPFEDVASVAALDLDARQVQRRNPAFEMFSTKK